MSQFTGKPILAVPLGDAAGIGPEIIAKLCANGFLMEDVYKRQHTVTCHIISPLFFLFDWLAYAQIPSHSRAAVFTCRPPFPILIYACTGESLHDDNCLQAVRLQAIFPFLLFSCGSHQTIRI